MTRRRSRAEYEGLLASREREGLSYREAAERAGVKPATLAWWAWRLRREGGRGPAFTEVVAAADGGDRCGITIECDGVRLHVVRDFDAAVLRRVLDVLAQRC